MFPKACQTLSNFSLKLEQLDLPCEVAFFFAETGPFVTKKEFMETVRVSNLCIISISWCGELKK
jgi:hypothetical protein